MRLFIDTGAATADSTDWEEFEYVINRLNPDAAGAYLELEHGRGGIGNRFCTVPYSVRKMASNREFPEKRWGLGKIRTF